MSLYFFVESRVLPAVCSRRLPQGTGNRTLHSSTGGARFGRMLDTFHACSSGMILPAAVRCDMVLPRVFRARHVRTNGIGSEVRRGVTSGVSCETSLNKYVTPRLHRE